MKTLFTTPEPIVQVTACMASPKLTLEGASSQLYALGFSKESGVSLEEVSFEFKQDELWYGQAGGSILIVLADYDETKQRLKLELIREENKVFPVCKAEFWECFPEHWLDFHTVDESITMTDFIRLNNLT